MKDIEVALRIVPKVEEARQALRQFNGEARETAKAVQQAASAPSSPATASPPSSPAPTAPKPDSGSKETEEAARKAEAELRKQQRALDDLAASQAPAATGAQKLAAIQQQLDGALAKGLITQEKHAQLLLAATDRYDENAVALRKLTGDLDPAATGTQKLAAAQQQLDAAVARGSITQEQHGKMLEAARQKYGALGVSAGQTAQAMRQLPAQITDVATSLASGMPAWMVAIQQGGQIKDSFGSIGAAAVGLVRTLGMMINPWALLAGAMAGAALAYKQGSDEDQRFRNGLELTGHTAGVTAGQLDDMAARVSKVTGTTSVAADALAQLVEAGQEGPGALEAMGRAAVAMNEATGKAVASTVAEFAKLRGDPLKGIEELSGKYRFLTAAVYAQIKALVEQGDKEAAIELAQQTAARALEQRAAAIKKNLGYVEAAWDAITKVAKGAWDAMLGVGRTETDGQELERLTRQRAELVKLQGAGVARMLGTNPDTAGFGGNNDADVATLDARIALLRKNIEAENQLAKARSDAQRKEDAGREWIKEEDKYLSGRAKLDKEHEDAEKWIKALAKEAGMDESALNQRLAQENARYQKELASLPNTGLQNAKAQAALTAAQLRQDLAQLQAGIALSDGIITTALEKGRVSIQDAYQARLDMLAAESQAQRKVLEQERAEIQKELASARTPAERAGAQQRVVEVNTQIKVLDTSLAEGTRKLGLWKTEQEKNLASITASIKVDVAGITGQFDRQAVEEQLKLQYQGQYDAAGRIDNAAESKAARERIDLLIQAGAAQAEFNARLAEAQRLQQQLGVIEAAIQQRAASGQISQVEAEAQIAQARRAQVPALSEIVAGLERIKGSVPAAAAVTIDGMAASIGGLRNEVAAATPVVVSLGTRLRNTMIDGVADAAATAVANFHNLRDAAATTLKQIAADIVRSDIKRLLTNLFTPSSTGGSTVIGGVIGSIGKVFGFAEGGSPSAGGGRIVGPGTGTSDSIAALVDGKQPIAVSNGEFIHPERAVKHYGLPFMEAVRTLRLPKPATYAAGGIVKALRGLRPAAAFAMGGLLRLPKPAAFAAGGVIRALGRLAPPAPRFAFGGLVRAHRAARFAQGGPVGMSADAPQVSVTVVNNGTPQQVTGQQVSMADLQHLIITLYTDDMRRGGPMSRAASAAQARG